jgi:hypothetical protein
VTGNRQQGNGGSGGSGGGGATSSGAAYGGGGFNPESGAVRIIWGAGRAFPSTCTGDK